MITLITLLLTKEKSKSIFESQPPPRGGKNLKGGKLLFLSL
ncbi:hypothetical protein HMPREF3222_02873 [Clostridium perfringens]|uniref:Uncharacterized protein n=1 Tax=Clostridium perfringens TaxID=1502 RepID=A0A133MS58_CLOPF|nr:hypothetical protein HMPREF3222_02873 [Clostridium perfringens]